MKRFTVSLLLLVSACGNETSSQLDVIYGSDDRKDVYKVNDPQLADLARATAIIIPDKNLKRPASEAPTLPELNMQTIGDLFELFSNKETNNQSAQHSDVDVQGDQTSDEDFLWAVRGESIGKSNDLCEDEPFWEQPSPGVCSGFLIAPDLVATAGHCLSRGCNGFKVAFNYFYDESESAKDLRQIPSQDVYACEEVLGAYLDRQTQLDFGVFRLDRPVEGVKPVKLRASGKIKAGTPLVVIGYPMGLPGKVIEGGNTQATATDQRYHFVGNLDTYGGNSGSAVFNAQTYEVEGILVRGDDDLVETSEGCFRSKRCIGNQCKGEDVTRIATLKQFLDSMPDPAAPKSTRTFHQNNLRLAIPDNDDRGVEIHFLVEDDAQVLDASLKVELLHPSATQVSAKLIHPEGFVIDLGSEGEAGRKYDLTASYEFLHLRGLSGKGLWRLVLADEAEGRTGAVDSATLHLVVAGADAAKAPPYESVAIELTYEDGVAIPDANEGELTLSFEPLVTAKTVRGLALTTDIEHPYVSDLTLTLISPQGTPFVVFNGERGSSNDLTLTFGVDGVDVPGLDEAFAGEFAGGQWKVKLTDSGPGDTGVIRHLRLNVLL